MHKERKVGKFVENCRNVFCIRNLHIALEKFRRLTKNYASLCENVLLVIGQRFKTPIQNTKTFCLLFCACYKTKLI